MSFGAIDIQAWRSRIRADAFGRYHLNMAAAILRLENDAPTAIAHLRQAVAIEPGLDEAHALLIDLLAASADVAGAAAAQAAADAVGADYRGAGRCWRVLRALNEAGPVQAGALMERLGPPDGGPSGRQWAALALIIDTAQGRYDTTRRAFPDGLPPSPAVAALDTEIAAAFAALTEAPDHGLPTDVAIQTTSHAVRLGADLAAPYMQLAHLLNAGGQTVAALDVIEQGLARFSEDALLWETKGEILLNVETRLSEAPAALQEALRLNPKLVGARSAARRALTVVGRMSEAIDAVRTALAEDPGNPTLMNECGMFLHVRQHQGDEDAALEQYAGIFRHSPRAPNPLWMSAMIHARRGDITRARELADRAVAVAPTAAHPLSASGLIALIEGKREEAVGLCRQAAERNKPPAQNHIQCLALGLALEAAGQDAEADAMFREAVTAAPGGVWLAHRLLGPFQAPLETALARIGFTRTGYWPAAVS